MKQVIVFAGTTEGRILSQELSRQGVFVLACVATEYGEQLVERLNTEEYLKVQAGRLNQEAMEQLFLQEQPDLVVDATHPYASAVSKNIRESCQQTGREYLRLIRQESLVEEADCTVVEDTKAAVEYLQGTSGNVLLTTGSKELAAFTQLRDYQERLYARVLPMPEVVRGCQEMGFTGTHLLCMQGPFSQELNEAMLRQVKARYLVTKESGKVGGFPEKLAAAKNAGVQVVLIGRPGEQPGKSPQQVCRILEQRFSLSRPLRLEEQILSGDLKGKQEASDSRQKRQVILAGIGMGVPENMTREVWEACRQADCLIGAKRMLACVKEMHKPTYSCYRPLEIRDYLTAHPEYGRAVVLLSGDVGFYSGAKGLLEAFADTDFQVNLLPGISSVVYLCSRLKTSWEDVKLLSVHGRKSNLVAAVRENPKVFTLLSGSGSVGELCRQLEEYGLGQVKLTVGERLHYPEECLRSGSPGELAGEHFGELCAALIENPGACSRIPSCVPDEAFIRGKAPMTKSEVRSVSVAKLCLPRDAVVYDVGAGTGSVSVEMALQAPEGMVYAVEKKEEAAGLIQENMRLFGTPNIQVVRGSAPEALEELPAPTHAFIGGSSGNLGEILARLLEKNPRIRLVINAVTLETLSEIQACLSRLPLGETEILQLSIAKARTLGSYHLLTGQNPVFIVSCTGTGQEL